MYTNEYIYQPNSITSDIFLSEIPLELMKENILAQFKNPLEFRKKDHITTFINMYRFSEENADIYEDEDLDNVNQLRDSFYSYMNKLFVEFLGIGIVDFDTLSKREQDDLIHYTYRFFIINIKRNFVSFILNYIENHKDEFVSNDEEKKKDVTSITFKKDIADPDELYILSDLSNIIKYILHRDILIDDFIDGCDSIEPSLETRFVKKQFDSFKLTGNFVPKYVEMLDYDFLSEIESKVRNTILKKYRN